MGIKAEIYQRNRTLPDDPGPAQVNPSVGAIIPNAIKDVADTAARTTEVIEYKRAKLAEAQEKLKKEKESNYIIQSTNDYNDEINSFEEEAYSKLGSAAIGLSDDLRKRRDDFEKRALSGMDLSEDSQVTLKNNIHDAWNVAADRISKYERQEQRNSILAGITTAKNQAASSTFDDPDSLDMNILRMKYQYENLVQNGVMSREDADAEMETVKQDLAIASAEGRIDHDPHTGWRSLTSGEYDEEIPAKERSKLIKAAKDEEDRRKKEADTEDEKRTKEIHDKTERDMWLSMDSGKLTMVDVNRAVRKGILSDDEAETWRKRLEDRSKTTEEQKTDPKVYDEVSKRFYDTKDLTMGDLYGKYAKGLSVKDREHFAEKVRARDEKQDKQTKMSAKQKNAMKFIDNLRGNHAFDDSNAGQNNILWYTYRQQLEDYIKENPDEDPEEYIKEATKEYWQTKTQKFINAVSGAWQKITGGSEEAGAEPTTSKSETSENMPDPAKYAGKTMLDSKTGKRYHSDGTKWNPI